MMKTSLILSIVIVTVLFVGCFEHDVEYTPGRVIVQFYPDIDRENASQIMENLSLQYNFTIEYWDRYFYKHCRENDTFIKGWEANINVTVGREKWFASELEKNETIYRAMLDYAIG